MRVLAIFIAVVTGLVVLVGYFVPVLLPIETIFLNWALALAGTAALMGVFNLISVHGEKIRRKDPAMPYSALLLFSLFATFIFGLIPPGPSGPTLTFLFNSIILPSQAALMALLAITLLYFIIRLLRHRPDLMSIVFIVSALLIMLGTATLPFGEIPLLGNWVRPWMTEVLAMGGARGLLIGVGLGTLVTGLRVVFGVDRPYGGK